MYIDLDYAYQLRVPAFYRKGVTDFAGDIGYKVSAPALCAVE